MEYDFQTSSGFSQDPNAHQSVGYVTSLKGFGMATALVTDLTVLMPVSPHAVEYTGIGTTAPPSPSHPTGTLQVVGVIQSLNWSGGAGDPLELEFYVSKENAAVLLQRPLKSTEIEAIGFWICQYDQGSKHWYEAFYPLGTEEVKGTIANKNNPALEVDSQSISLNGAPPVHKVSIQVAPVASSTVKYATSPTVSVAKQWGMQIESPAEAAKTGA
jgi:hypothetical protein